MFCNVFRAIDANSLLMQIMLHLFTISGQWMMDNVGLEFLLDPGNKGNVFVVEEDIKYI